MAKQKIKVFMYFMLLLAIVVDVWFLWWIEFFKGL